MPTYSNLIDNKQLLDFSQNFIVQRPAYLGSMLFPDRKTEFIQQEYSRVCENGNLPMMASVHAYDTEAQIGSRIPFEKVEVEELLIKEKINVSENMNKLTRGLSMSNDSLRNYIFDDVANMSERVVTRAELAKMDALSKGKYVISGNGLDMYVDYGIPTSNFVSGDWSEEDADILGDIRTWRLIAIAGGMTPDLIITTENILLVMMKNAGIQRAIFGTVGAGTLPSLEQINSLLGSQFGLRIRTNEARYGSLTTGANGKLKVEQNRFFPEGKFVMISTSVDGTLGVGLWGVTPEEANQGGAFDTKRQNQYVTVTTWDTPDPVATWTKASGLMVPVMPNVYGHIIADINTIPAEKEDEEEEGGKEGDDQQQHEG